MRQTTKKNKLIVCKCGCGKILWLYDKQWRKRSFIHGHNWKGKTRIKTKEQIQKQRQSMIGRTGENSLHWKGGLTPLKNRIRSSNSYKKWILSVFKRDNYTCQICKTRGIKLNVHHKDGFKKIMEENNIKTLKDALSCEKLWNIDNGITFCRTCHKLEHNWNINPITKN